MFLKYSTLIILFTVSLFNSLKAQTHFYFVEDASDLGGNCYRITPNLTFQKGAVWALHSLDLNQDFTLDFSISFGSNDVDGADGITFCLHNTCSDIGNAGGGMGYEGMTSSIAIEFDTWQNTNLSDPWFDHVAIISNGNVNHAVSTTNLAGPVQASASSTNIEDGANHDILIQWETSSQTFQIFFDGNLRLSYTGDIINNIFGGNPEVNWGFTGSTGGSVNQQDFCINNYPEPVTLEDEEICIGESVQVNLPEGLNYSWSPNVWINNPSIHNPIFTPSASTLYTVTITDDCGRTSTDDIQIDVKLPPSVGTQTDIICLDGTRVLSLDEPYLSYLWSNGSMNSTLTIGSEGTYWVDVTNDCGTERAFFEVELYIPEANLDHIEELYCTSSSVIDLSGGMYELDGNPITSLNPAELSTGNYTLTYTFTDPDTGCSNTVSKDFEIVETIIPEFIDLPTIFCPTDNIFTLLASPVGGVFEINGVESTEINPQTLGIGTHDVIYTYSNGGCEFTITEQIIINQKPPISFTNLIDGYCLEDEAFTIGVEPMGGIIQINGVTTSILNPASLGMGSHNISYTYTISGGCSNEIFKDINIATKPLPIFSPNPNEDIFICPANREGILLSAEGSETVLWNTGSTSPSININRGGTYIAKLNNGLGCDVELVFEVYERCEPLFSLPNAFSPNGDGLNDVFQIIGGDLFKLDFKIYNRWGELVYSSVDIQEVWDGTLRGKDVPEGTYIWKASYENILDPSKVYQKKGKVSLVR